MSRRKKKSPGIITPVSLEALLSLWDEPARKKAAARPSRPRRKKEVPAAENGEMMSRDQFMREPFFDWLEEQFGRVRILEEIDADIRDLKRIRRILKGGDPDEKEKRNAEASGCGPPV